MKKPVKRYEDTAANWTADNPTLPAGWEGVESDTGLEKHGDGLTAWNSLGYSVGYKEYTALLTQTGTDAPVPTVLKNTLGGPVVWSRNANGRYAGTLAGAFAANKTAVNSGVCVGSAGDTLIGCFAGNRTDANTVRIVTSAMNDLSGASDDVLVATEVSIKVYPA